MAPKRVSKRPAAAAASGPAPKKRELGATEIIAQKCKLVSDELLSASALPTQVAEMLAAMIPESLGVFSDQRHALQVQAVNMIRSTFAELEAALVETSGQTSASIDALAGEVAVGDAEKAAAESSLEASQAAHADRKVEFDGAGVALHRATLTVSEAKDAQLKGDQNLVEAAERKGKIEAVLSETYAALKEGRAEDVKRAIAEVVGTAKLFSMDSSMVTALPQVLCKQPGERGCFDTMVVNSFEAEAQKCASDLAALLEAGEPSKAERAAAVEAAITSQNEARAAQEAGREALAAAKEEVKQRTAALKTAQSKAAALQQKAALASSAHSAAEAALANFRAGPLATLQELEARCSPAPVPEAKIIQEPEEKAVETSLDVPAMEPADVVACDA